MIYCTYVEQLSAGNISLLYMNPEVQNAQVSSVDQITGYQGCRVLIGWRDDSQMTARGQPDDSQITSR